MKHFLPLLLFLTTTFFIQTAYAQVFTVGGPEVICTGSSATLTASGCSGSLRWNNGPTTASITIRPNATMTYEVTCTTDAGATTARITPIVVPILQLATNGNACLDNGTTLSALDSGYRPASGRLRWKRDGALIQNASTGTFAPVQPGGYTVEPEAEHWSVQYGTPDANRLFTSLDFVGTSHGWVGDAKGPLLKTADGGRVWRPASLQRVHALDFVTETTGYAVARGSTAAQALYKSTDGGNNWTEQLALADSGVADIRFVDDRVGWASNGSNVVYRTSDGGQTWQAANPGLVVRSLFFLNATMGWAAGDPGKIARTTDGGASWTLYTVANSHFPTTRIYFKNASEGWLYNGAEAKKTSNGGISWDFELYSNFPAPFATADFATEDFGIAIGEGYVQPYTHTVSNFYKTHDGGKSYTREVIPGINDVFLLKLVDQSHGWAVSRKMIAHYAAPAAVCPSAPLALAAGPPAPTILADHGEAAFCGGGALTLSASGCAGALRWNTGQTTASITASPTVSTLYTATCTASNGCQSQTSYSQGVVPKPALSANGPACAGANVRLTASGVNATGLLWKRDGAVVSVGTGSVIANTAGVYSAEDSASRGVWVPYAAIPAGQNFRSMSFADENTVWAVSGNTRLLKTTDGGKNWRPLPHFFNLPANDFLTDVEFTTAGVGWVSSRSKVYKTTDGGLSWTTQFFDVNVSLTELFFLDSQRGWAAGRNLAYGQERGVLLRTTDGGVTWRDASSVMYSPVTKIFFASATTGWAVSSNGYAGILYKSTDGGTTWQSQTAGLPPTQPITTLYFQDETHGWAGSAESLFKTGNGGATWVTLPLPATLPYATLPYAVRITDGRGWVLSEDAAFFTNNGGQSWAVHAYGGAIQAISASVFFPSGNILAAGSAGRLTKFQARPADCRATLAILPAPAPPVVSPAGPTVICAGQSVTLTASDCAGAVSWSNGGSGNALTATPAATATYSAYCSENQGCRSAPASVGVAVVPRPTLTRSAPDPCNRPVLSAEGSWPGPDFVWKRDGAVVDGTVAPSLRISTAGIYTAGLQLSGVWLPQSVSGIPFLGLADVHFVNHETGYAVGNDYLFLSTRDGGRHWRAQSLPLAGLYFVRDVFFADPDHGWVLTKNYNDYEYTDLLTTTDGGQSWTKSKVPGNELKAIFFTSNTVGWCVGTSSRILKTTDARATWQIGAAGGSFESIFFLDSQHGWVAGYNQKLLSTSDGGSTWTTRTVGNVVAFRSLQFTSLSEGWAAYEGKNGLYRTTDGGDTWNQVVVDAQSDAYPKRVQFVNDSTGFVLSGKFIYATTDRGVTWKKSYHQLSAGGMWFTDATHGWVVGDGISTYQPTPPACASAPMTVLPEAIAPLSTLTSGSWDTPDVWSCGTIPTAQDAVLINSGHSITLPADYSAKAKSIVIQGEVQSGPNAGLQLGQE